MEEETPKKAHHVNKIPLADLADLIAAIEALQPDENKTLSGAQFLKRIARQFRAALKQGVTASQISTLILTKGIELQAATIRALVRKRKPLPKEKVE